MSIQHIKMTGLIFCVNYNSLLLRLSRPGGPAYAIGRLHIDLLFIELGSPWKNGYIGSFNGKLRDELLDREIFTTLDKARVLIESWRKEYNQVRPTVL